jgi:YbgC/YbaW family acyl-CoA thioester hydrolase
VSDSFRYRRRVQFAETDLAGIVHFSWMFRYMEEAEHALWRAAGLSVSAPGAAIVWPRVSATFDYRNPLHFEDEFDVIVRVDEVTRRSVRFAFVLERGDTPIGSGTLTATSASRNGDGVLRSVAVPEEMVERLRAAAIG